MSTRHLPIGLVGCGWIGGLQLDAYRAAGFRVEALYDRHPDRAEGYRDKFFPDAQVYASLDELLSHPGLAVVDVATHLEGRPETVLRCIQAGVNVLSQKPFVDDLAVGAQLAAAARDRDVLLGVNQNGRWAPHFAALLGAVRDGRIGTVVSADFLVAWPHDEIVNEMPAFASMPDLVLFDFGAHWFDVIGELAPAGALTVYATAMRRADQEIGAPLQASAIVTGTDFIATVNFRAGERFAEVGSFRVSGTRGVVTHEGLSLGGESVVVHEPTGATVMSISDDWFGHGLAGAMEAMLDAVDGGYPPPHSPESAMRGLSIAFAALESARTGLAVQAGAIASRNPTD